MSIAISRNKLLPCVLCPMSYTLEMEAISAIAAASGVFLAGLERDQSTEAAAS
jgi:hypothetical protein